MKTASDILKRAKEVMAQNEKLLHDCLVLRRTLRLAAEELEESAKKYDRLAKRLRSVADYEATS